MRVKQNWATLTVRLRVADVPNVESSYGTVTISPSVVRLDFVAQDGRWVFDSAEVGGHRIKKDGTPGQAHSTRNLYTLREAPGWLHDLVMPYLDEPVPTGARR